MVTFPVYVQFNTNKLVDAGIDIAVILLNAKLVGVFAALHVTLLPENVNFFNRNQHSKLLYMYSCMNIALQMHHKKVCSHSYC